MFEPEISVQVEEMPLAIILITTVLSKSISKQFVEKEREKSDVKMKVLY